MPSCSGRTSRLGDELLLNLKRIACWLMMAALAVTPALAQSAKTPGAKASTTTKKSAHHRKSRKGAWKRKGQQVIQPERVREIQAALIRENYLSGEPSGQWDARTQAAMARYQADHGWQSKVTPDSRALIKMGLGPNYQQGSSSLSNYTSPTGTTSARSSNKQ
ncbi:MAG TPA: peptidoglycan-binding domain-containing protein [Alphaproteobacteria bacterium]|nr:peptidoglycan-binding domain-containing protein [Alphaproteobacteria bacterium]